MTVVVRNVEWVPMSREGLHWIRRVRGGRTLGGIVFYRMRGTARASFWRAIRAPFSEEDKRSCLSLQEAVDWVELEPG